MTLFWEFIRLLLNKWKDLFAKHTLTVLGDVDFALLCKLSLFSSGIKLILAISPNLSFHSIKIFIQDSAKRQVKVLSSYFYFSI